jgi:PAS domain S-box-containing protein
MHTASPRLEQTEPLLMHWVVAIASMGKLRIMLLCGLLVVLISIVDSHLEETSLGVFYILPMILAATVLSPFEITLMALVCSILRGVFDSLATIPEHILRFVFAGATYTTMGLFTTMLVRSRQEALAHADEIAREHTLRKAVEEQLQVLVDSSPAAILTVDHVGAVIAANGAAAEILGIEEPRGLIGRPIRDYLPLLYDALQYDCGTGPFRTSAQCQGRRVNGEPFLANAWFSTYSAKNGLHLAAIVVDVSEEMRNQEEQKLRQLSAGSRIMAAAASHEIRNLCNGIALIYSGLKKSPGLSDGPGFQALGELVKGLEEMASLDLHSRSHETLEPVRLQQVLDNLRIIIQPDWDEIEGTIRWDIPRGLSPVLADSHGLLQALLNLARNSHRAVQHQPVRQLAVAVSSTGAKTIIQVCDSGPGISEPQNIFQPFQRGAVANGLGLYISRGLLRSYGGELRLEPGAGGAHFTIELRNVQEGFLDDAAFLEN